MSVVQTFVPPTNDERRTPNGSEETSTLWHNAPFAGEPRGVQTPDIRARLSCVDGYVALVGSRRRVGPGGR
jgi:hypothetical protein